MTQPNLWSLAKDPPIKALLILLEQRVGAGRFHIQDAVLHHQAVRIIPPVEKPEVSVYLYNYAQSAGHYGVDLEYPLRIEHEADDNTERLNEQTLDEAIEMIVMHLELELA